MEITIERSKEIGKSLKQMIEAMNSFSEDEIKTVIGAEEREETVGPLLHPTKYIGEADGNRQTKSFLQALLLFKSSVKGIGNCK